MKSFEQVKRQIYSNAFEYCDGVPYFPFNVNILDPKYSQMDEQSKFIELSSAIWISQCLGVQTNRAAHALGRCESPIEKMFLIALQYASESDEFYFAYDTADLVKKPDGCSALMVLPQAGIGKYRADFRISYCEIGPDHERSTTLPDGINVPGTAYYRAEVLVECDGHDFHEKTKQQASRDKARDRALAAAGFHVLRFTGSDIWKDAVACANEVRAFLHKRAMEPSK